MEIFCSSSLKRCQVPYSMTWACNVGIMIIKSKKLYYTASKSSSDYIFHKKNIAVLPLDYYCRDQQ